MSRSNMLALPVPTSRPLSSSLTAALRQAILSHAGETHHPDAFATDIASLVDLRSRVASMEEHVESLSAAYRYYAQLVFVTTKLPNQVTMAFPWSQPLLSPSLLAFGGGTGATIVDSATESAAELASIWNRSQSFAAVMDGVVYVGHPLFAWERANVLYAMATLLSSLGTQESRSDGPSIRRAVGYFQTSSAILSHLEEHVLPPLLPNLGLTTPSHGLLPSAVRPLATLTLAQAQECFWQKAVSDGMKSGTVAKLAKAVEQLYEKAGDEARRAEQEDGIEAIPRQWVNHITVKRFHFGAAAQYRRSQEDLANSRHGDEIARLQLAEGHVKSALAAFKKGLPSSASAEAIGSDLRGLQGVVETNLKRARKDNDLIYLDPVTPLATLAAIPAAGLVQPKLPMEVAKPIDCLRAGPATDNFPALGRPLFGSLVPYGAHLAVSVYEDRKENWWKDNVEGKRQELEDLVKSALESLSLPSAIDALDRPDSKNGADRQAIPAALLSQAQDIKNEGGVQRLHQLRSNVEQMSARNFSTLQQAQEVLETEAQEDAQVRADFAGSKHWTRQESRVAAEAYWRRMDELANTLKMARDSDTVVKGKIEKWSRAWQVLEAGEQGITAQLPSGQRSTGESSGVTNSSQIVREIRTLLEAIDDRLSEFAALSSETKSLVRSDDIREKIMREVARLSSDSPETSDVEIGPEMFESLFDVEFNKYRTIENELGTFDGKIGNLLEQLAQRNETFTAQLQANSSIASSRNSTLSNLFLSASKYLEVHSNLSEGLKFYNSLAPLITEFKDQVAQWRRARQIDVQHLVSRFEGTSLEARKKGWDQSAEGSSSRTATPTKRSTRSSAAKARSSTAQAPVEDGEDEVRRALEGLDTKDVTMSEASNGDALIKQRFDHSSSFLQGLFDGGSKPEGSARPHVTLTFAQTLDGYIAGKKGRQLRLSGEESMAMTHCLRTLHDAILVGVGTVLNDDPRLNARLLPTPPSASRQPQPIVLDSTLRTPPTCRLLTNHQSGQGRQPIIVTMQNNGNIRRSKKKTLESAGALIYEVNKMEWPIILEALGHLGIQRLMVEGGARVIETLLCAKGPEADSLPGDLVDTLIVTVSPTLAGSESTGYRSPAWPDKLKQKTNSDNVNRGADFQVKKRDWFGDDAVWLWTQSSEDEGSRTPKATDEADLAGQSEEDAELQELQASVQAEATSTTSNSNAAGGGPAQWGSWQGGQIRFG